MNTISEALIITRREIRDSFRDWRIVSPILLLTLIFPFIMNLSTRIAIAFVEAYQATIIPLHLIPFALMIVGFFPITFSLVIALETFVGEKERNSLEPLLGSPLSDSSLYLGKLLAALAPPLLASYLGIGTYLVSLYFSISYIPEPGVLLQIVVMTSMEAMLMVAAAVVASAHTTSVRAANLLASFIIMPMAFLLQGESVLLFWGYYDALWFVIAALAVVDVILFRIGTMTFNREEILAREVDALDFRRMAFRFRVRFKGVGGFSVRRVYLQDLPALLRANLLPLAVTVAVVLGSFALGSYLAVQYPLPSRALVPFHVAPGFENALQGQDYGFLPRLDTLSIFGNNVRSLAVASALAVFSFGIGALLLLLIPLVIVGFFTAALAQVGVNPVLFLGAFILPHGILELPAAIIATGFALRLGAAVMSPPHGGSVGDNFIDALSDWVKVFLFLVLPLLLVAALVEATLTPRIVTFFFGG
jgi:uncharacterized membrane protein SpoIIM required for sporulation